jgi:hypothetical protein
MHRFLSQIARILQVNRLMEVAHVVEGALEKPGSARGLAPAARPRPGAGMASESIYEGLSCPTKSSPNLQNKRAIGLPSCTGQAASHGSDVARRFFRTEASTRLRQISEHSHRNDKRPDNCHCNCFISVFSSSNFFRPLDLIPAMRDPVTGSRPLRQRINAPRPRLVGATVTVPIADVHPHLVRVVAVELSDPAFKPRALAVYRGNVVVIVTGTTFP